MNDVNMNNHFIKVNKIVLAILSFILLTRIILIFIGIDKSNLTYVPIGILLIGVIVSSVFVYKNVFNRVTSFILMLSFLATAAAATSDSYVTGMIMILGICISSIFLDKLLLLSTGLLSSVMFIIIQALNHNLKIEVLVFIMMITFVLYFVCKWGSDLIKVSTYKEAHAKELLNSLDDVFNVIQENTLLLNKDISSCNEETCTLKEFSNSMSLTVQEITNGVMEQSGSIENISNMINKADEKMSEINMHSRVLADNAGSANQVVLDGSEKINHLDKQMGIISTAVTESVTTVQELNSSMDEVNNFLSSITKISEQTNLLALNAAIEAARAGESGKGFAVVADEVRKLAEQSSNTVKEIDKIISEIKAKTGLVLEKVNRGSIAVKDGEVAIKQVNGGFERIRHSFKNIDEYVSDELKMTESIVYIFRQIREHAESIARVAEEHSAAMEEMQATSEDQNANIESIHGLMQSINNSSIRLQELIAKG